MESRRVVNEDGNEDNDSEDEVSDLTSVFGKGGTDLGAERTAVGGTSDVVVSSKVGACPRSFPIPIWS